MPEIGVIQMRCSQDPSENLENAIALVRDAAAQGAQIICLPELFKTVYFCQEENHKYFQYAETIPVFEPAASPFPTSVDWLRFSSIAVGRSSVPWT